MFVHLFTFLSLSLSLYPPHFYFSLCVVVVSSRFFFVIVVALRFCLCVSDLSKKKKGETWRAFSERLLRKSSVVVAALFSFFFFCYCCCLFSSFPNIGSQTVFVVRCVVYFLRVT